MSSWPLNPGRVSWRACRWRGRYRTLLCWIPSLFNTASGNLWIQEHRQAHGSLIWIQRVLGLGARPGFLSCHQILSCRLTEGRVLLLCVLTLLRWYNVVTWYSGGAVSPEVPVCSSGRICGPRWWGIPEHKPCGLSSGVLLLWNNKPGPSTVLVQPFIRHCVVTSFFS